MHRSLPALALLLAAAACGAIRFGPDTPVVPPPAIAGTWAGAWQVEGQRLEGTLVLRQNGTDLSATFSSSGLGADATGNGKVETDGRLRLQFKYRTTCSGTADLTGTADPAGRIGGSLSASDCTGKATGTFAFTRR